MDDVSQQHWMFQTENLCEAYSNVQQSRDAGSGTVMKLSVFTQQEVQLIMWHISCS